MKTKKLYIAVILFSIYISIPTFAAGWKYENQNWKYKNQDGSYMKSCIASIGDDTYIFDENGWMISNTWVYLEKEQKKVWYYCYIDGSIAKNTWIGDYYLTDDGSMAIDTWIGKYYVDKSGKWVPGKTKNSHFKQNHIYGYYSTKDVYSHHSANHLIQLEIYPDKSGQGYYAIANFGLFDGYGNTGDYYSKSNPNGDALYLMKSDNYHYKGKSESDGYEYQIEYNGDDTIILYWKKTGAWDIDGRKVTFKKEMDYESDTDTDDTLDAVG